MQWVNDNFALIFALCVGWVVFITLAALLHRRRTNRPIRTPHPSTTLHAEHWITGYRGRFPLNPFRSARNCLFLLITPSGFSTGFELPFSSFPMCSFFGLEHTVSSDQIQSVTLVRAIIGRDCLRISFTPSTRHRSLPPKPITLLLHPREPDTCYALLQNHLQRTATPTNH